MEDKVKESAVDIWHKTLKEMFIRNRFTRTLYVLSLNEELDEFPL